ncbi:MAG: hypothetical protein ACTSPI_03515 [Candidatus Heimdallarchaeaceae archaeon]
MKIKIIIIMLLLLSSVYAETIKTCIDSNTLQIITNKTISIDGVAETIDIYEEVNCPSGCVNGKCKPTNLNMIVEIYIFLSIFGVTLMLISFFKSDVLIFKWLSFGIFLMLAITSFNVNKDFCEYTSSGWVCHVQEYRMLNLAYLWFGLALIMLIYSFIASITQPGDFIAEQEKKPDKTY